MKCPNCSNELKTETRMVGETQRIYDVCSSCGFEAGKNYLKVEEIWAWVSVDPQDQNEGIITVNSPMGPMPMVGADKERMKSLRELAEQAAKNAGIEVKLLRFSTRSEIEIIPPSKSDYHS